MNRNNTMEMVWHYNEYIQYNIFTHCGGCNPFICNNISRIIQHHYAIDDFPKQACVIMRTYRQKIHTRLCIIIPLQANGPAVMNFSSTCRCSICIVLYC